VLAALGLDTDYLVAKGPQILQAFFAAMTDMCVYMISLNLHGDSVAKWTLVCQLVSWFNGYCLVRTYSNSVEASLTTLGMVWFIKAFENQCLKKTFKNGAVTSRCVQQWPWMIAAAFSTVMRPPSGMFWALSSAWYVLRLPKQLRLVTILKGLSIGSAVLLGSIMLDRIWYGEWVLVPWNFFEFNVLTGGSGMYGKSPWYWNFTCLFPALLASYIPLLIIGVRSAAATGEE